MKIKRISCTQFAGMRDKSVDLGDGVNVIYGKNESGKSTLVNLLARTLFQNAKLDGRSDRAFRELYFPAGRGDGVAKADFVDGTVTIEGADGTYILSKAWGEGGGCTLSTPDGAVRDQKKINEILRSVLLYGEGVYHDILLTAQREQGRALETLLDAAQKTEAQREIAGAAARAFVESGGVSIEAVGAAIAEKRRELEGAHWDAERGGPEKRASGRWSKELGEVLKAWYALEDAKETFARVERLEDAADRAAVEYADADAAAAEAEREFYTFDEYAGRLEARSEQQRRLKSLEAQLENLRGVLDEWPELTAPRDAASALKAAAEEVRRCAGRLDALPNPSARELREAAEADREIQRLENRLFGMNLAARLRMLDGRGYELRSLRTGETLCPEGEKDFKITEAVRLTVPGVMELTLSPADVDTAALGRRLAAERSRLGEIYARYSVASIEEWQALAGARRAAETELADAENRRTLALGGVLLAAGIALTMILTRRLTRPILELSRQMENLQDIQVYEELPVGKTRGEARILYESFNHLVSTVQRLVWEIQQAAERRRRDEFRMLASQINPHFLYNTLGSISWMAESRGATDIQEMTMDLVGMLRNGLNHGNIHILLRNEIEQVRCYVGIMKKRYPENYEFVFDIQEDTEDYWVIKQILQPLVENSIQYGLLENDGGKVTVRAYTQREELVLEVRNTGQLADLGKIYMLLQGNVELRSRHYGIRNVDERLKNRYGEQSGLKYTIEGDETVAAIRIPLERVIERPREEDEEDG